MKDSILGFSLIGVLLTALAARALAGDSQDEAIKKDRQQIAGTWQIVALEIDGKRQEPKGLTVVNGTDGTWILLANGKEISKGTSRFDTSKSPRTIDFIVTEGQGKGKQHVGIYELSANARKLCFGPLEKERPRQFSTTAGSGHFLVILERVKGK